MGAGGGCLQLWPGWGESALRQVPSWVRALPETGSCPRFEQDNLHRQSRAPGWGWERALPCQASAETPPVPCVWVVMGKISSKSVSHNPFGLISSLFQRSKLKSLVSIVPLPTQGTFPLGHFLIWLFHLCPGFGFPFGKGRGSKY